MQVNIIEDRKIFTIWHAVSTRGKLMFLATNTSKVRNKKSFLGTEQCDTEAAFLYQQWKTILLLEDRV